MKRKGALSGFTTRKSINTNGNTERIFPSVNFRGILLTEIFPRYIPRELQWEKKLKQSKKNKIDDGKDCEHCSSCQLQRESPTENSVGIFQRAPELFTFQLHS
jgi:Na+-translocating ferredoxin:NAD+ oxidoreductase RnfC subunit